MSAEQKAEQAIKMVERINKRLDKVGRPYSTPDTMKFVSMFLMCMEELQKETKQ